MRILVRPWIIGVQLIPGFHGKVLILPPVCILFKGIVSIAIEIIVFCPGRSYPIGI